MKNTLSTILCVLLTVALIAAAVSIGAVRGWSGERKAALNVLSTGGDDHQALQNRAMDAANLAVVVSRHLPDSADVAALRAAYKVICTTNASADEIVSADMAITEAAARLAGTLELASVQASVRDQVYITTLTRTLSQPAHTYDAYAAAIADYNTRLESSLTGKLAMLLGVTPLATAGATGGN